LHIAIAQALQIWWLAPFSPDAYHRVTKDALFMLKTRAGMLRSIASAARQLWGGDARARFSEIGPIVATLSDKATQKANYNRWFPVRHELRLRPVVWLPHEGKRCQPPNLENPGNRAVQIAQTWWLAPFSHIILERS